MESGNTMSHWEKGFAILGLAMILTSMGVGVSIPEVRCGLGWQSTNCPQKLLASSGEVLLSSSSEKEFDPFHQAVTQANQAYSLSQIAEQQSEWLEVASLWQSAIAQMRLVPQDHSQYNISQDKILEYQNYLALAKNKVLMG